MTNLTTLAGSGSYFIYDLDGLKSHATSLTQADAKLFFACKANPLGAVLSTLDKAGICFDISSGGELQQVLSQGIPGERIIMTGPAKSEKLIRQALENRVSTFVIESPNQLVLLQELTNDYSFEPNILLRLQLQWQDNEKSVLGGNQITAFGVDLETARSLLPKIRLPLLGFHVFQWGNILSVDKLRRVWQSTAAACHSLTKDFKVLDVGGGLGIPYALDEPELDWHTVSQLIQEIKSSCHIKEFWLEMGRYLTGPHGKYVTSVVDRKQTYGKDILVLEGGINHIARPALINESFFPATMLRASAEPAKPFALHGPLCTSLDFLGNHMLPTDCSVGDVIVFSQTGAYGFTESMPLFLCHAMPGEAVMQGGKLQVVRAPKTADFWMM